LKIGAIFSDYDGTLAPEDVTREASHVPKDVQDALLRLSSSVPVAIVTSKDFGFIRPRTDFARAWSCVSGIETVLSDGRVFGTPVKGLHEALQYVKRHDHSGLTLEIKHGITGEILGFSLDWRNAAPHEEYVRTTMEALTRLGLAVAYDPTRPYVDFFGAKPDKGRAVRELKKLLGVSGNVLFFGNSITDNPAFDEADLGICVAHGQETRELKCGFTLRPDELGGFLRSLADDALSLDLRTLKRK
jgi:hydroxymethylpyrimidine pyrophosphatase-like HAD family hydrolase